MKILLLAPEFPDTFWSFSHALKFIHRRASTPPLGLITVAAMLPAKWEKRVVDLNVSILSDADLDWADYAFIGAMVVQKHSARRLIARCRAAGVPVVAGGPLFTAEHKQFPEVDHLVLDEAELTLPDFLADVALGKPKSIYRGSGYADIRTTPVPLWELIDFRKYASMGVQFCRGCPYDCEFCNVTAMFGHRPRTKTTSQIIGELDRLYDLGWRGTVFFVDDNLIGNKKMLKSELLPRLAEWQHPKRRMPFTSQVSMNLADDDELLHLMAAAGFDNVFVGIETPDDDALSACNKKQNVGRNLVEDVKRIQRAGIEVSAGFIVGFDGDTADTFRRQIDFIQRSGIVTAMVGMLQAPAGTRLYERMLREGRLLGEMTGDNVDGTTNLRPQMGLELLQERYRALLSHIYSPRHYYRRVRTFLLEFETPAVRQRLDLQRLLALLRSAVRLGILGRERFQYWRLLAWTIVMRPRLLPRAVTLAIYGHHFRRIAELPSK